MRGGATTGSRPAAGRPRAPRPPVSRSSCARRARRRSPSNTADAMHRLYRALLRLYPAEFRDEYGREMAQMVRDRIAREPRSRLWIDLLRDLMRTAPKEHAHVLLNDVRYAVRLIRRAPMFTAAVVGTVALAIAANTAIFGVVNAVLLRPLPFAEPGRLIQVAEKNDALGLPNFGASVLNLLSWRERARSVDALSAIGFSSFTLRGLGEPEQLSGNRVSPSLMPLLGLAPVAGRAFTPDEERPGAPPVAMIGEGLWARRFGRDPAVVGRAVTLNGLPVTIVGVAPRALNLISGGDVYVPLTIDPSTEIRLNHVIFVAGRLKPRVTIQQAQAEFDTIAQAVAAAYPEMRDWGVHLLTFFDTFVSAQLKTGLLVLLGAVAFVLLIACANIANLLLSRSASRQKEIAVRVAMGATQSRVLRQLLVESVALSAIGGAIGIVAAVWAVRAINASLPPNLLPVPAVRVDAVVLSFAAGLTLLAGLIFGIAPACYTAKTDVHDMLKHTARTGLHRRGRRRGAGGRDRQPGDRAEILWRHGSDRAQPAPRRRRAPLRHRRRRRRRAQHDAEPGVAGDLLPAVDARVAADGRRRARGRAAGDAAAGAAAEGARDRRRAAARDRADDGRVAVGERGAAAAERDAARRVRGRRGADRRDWHLRRDRVLGEPAHAGNRFADGARRAARRRDAVDREGGHDRRRRRHRRGARRRVAPRTRDREPRLRGARRRSADVCGRRPAARAGRLRGVRDPGAPRGAPRSDGRATV